MPNEVVAQRADKPIKLDGRLDEEAWQKAQRITNFTQRELYEGEPATEPTECAVVYTDDYIYIAAWCWETSGGRLAAKYMKRDFPYWEEDNFEVIFDTFFDKRNGYVFVVNPNGAMADVQITDEGKGFNIDWDGVWDSAVEVNEYGWFVEIAIPFSTLKFPEKSTHVWGVNFERNIRRKQEQLFWQGWSRNYDFEHVSHAGTMLGLENIEGSEDFEFKPYITAGGELGRNSEKGIADIGGDFNYLMSPTMKLSLTANTDFAQVESDRAQINLSRFSLYFPEKRDFFLEGRHLFEMDMSYGTDMFYTRTIGLHKGEAVPIIGGARLVGKTGNSNIGAMSLQTAAKRDLPTTNHTVLRIKQDVLDKSYVGALITSKNSADHYNHGIALDAAYYTAKFLGDKNLVVQWQGGQTHTKDSIGGDNIASRLLISYPNDIFEAELILQTVGERFNPEMGFLRRRNYNSLAGNFSYNPRPDFIPGVVQINIEPADVQYFWDKNTGAPQSIYIISSPLGIETSGGDVVEFEMSRNYDLLDRDFELHEGAAISEGGHWWDRYGIRLTSFRGRRFTVDAGIWGGGYYSGNLTTYYASGMVNINRHLNVAADFETNIGRFGSAEFTTHEIGGRVEYSYSPKLHTSFFGQWNNQDREALLNFRLNWIPSPGSDLYIVVNQRISSTGGAISLLNTTILSKFVWRLGF
ncbi:MAG: DUF5916 domain-containing protein [Candidatus Kapaibacterium sp.]